MSNNKLEGVGPLPLLMVSLKRTRGAIDGFTEGRQGGNRGHVGPLPLSMVSSKDANEGGNREHHTHSGICVAFHLQFAAEKEWQVFISFPIRFFLNWSIEIKERIAVTQEKTRSANQIFIYFTIRFFLNWSIEMKGRNTYPGIIIPAYRRYAKKKRGAPTNPKPAQQWQQANLQIQQK